MSSRSVKVARPAAEKVAAPGCGRECGASEIKSRADRIRTCGLFVPNEARYQTALQLAACKPRALYSIFSDWQGQIRKKWDFFQLIVKN